MPHLEAVRTDWAIYWTLGKFLKPLAIINLPKSPTFLGNFCKGVKSIIFLVKSFLGNFYRHFVIFFWSHYQRVIIVGFVMKGSIPELLIIFHFLGLLKQLFYISVQGS